MERALSACCWFGESLLVFLVRIALDSGRRGRGRSSHMSGHDVSRFDRGCSIVLAAETRTAANGFADEASTPFDASLNLSLPQAVRATRPA